MCSSAMYGNVKNNLSVEQKRKEFMKVSLPSVSYNLQEALGHQQ